MILSAYAVPHPPLAVPEVGGDGVLQIPETVRAMDEISREVSRLRPDTVIFFTPHSKAYADFFHVAAGTRATGDFLRFGAEKPVFSAENDVELVVEISKISREKNFPAGRVDECHSATLLDHGVLVPMFYLNKFYADYKIVCVSQSGLDAAAHFRMGEIIAAAAAGLGRRVCVVASGDLSHKLGGSYGFAPEGEIFDRDVMKFLRETDFDALLAMPRGLREAAAECGYGSFAMLAGVLAGCAVSAKQLSYECPFGVGYGVVKFMVENSFRALARKSLEHRVKTGRDLTLPEVGELPPEMLSGRAGVFVSLHIGGVLRGCIGTIAPTTRCIAEEILRNAVSAGLYDSRFPPVNASELPHLTYKVDILDEPEDIAGPDELDVKKYGVIVECGRRRGLLLPNLDGVDTVAYQVEIACQKAGIAPGEKFSMQRFKVTRYE